MNSFLPPLNGLVLLDKPKGISSNAALMMAKRQLQQEKAGHGGTLDNLASGLLPVFFGSWTKLSAYCLNNTKQYRAIIRLGQQTDSGDAEGHIIKKLPVPAFQQKDLDLLADSMIGKLEQIPPAFSAIKVGGVPSYKKAAQARHNQTQMQELPPRWIEIHQLRLRALDQQHIDVAITTSKGAYIRTIGEQIAQRLKTCGYLVALRRTAVGNLTIKQAVTLEQLQASGQGWIDVDILLPHLPILELNHHEQDKVIQGQDLSIHPNNITLKENTPLADCGTIVALSPEGEIVALGSYQPAAKDAETDSLGVFCPKRVLMHN